MLKLIGRFIFYIQGWKVASMPPADIPKSVLIAAPHTSNWDFFIAMASFHHMKFQSPHFTIKKEWMRFPLNLIFKPIGGLPIDRSPKVPGEKRQNMVDVMADIINDHNEITMIITPEGTRKAVDEWKTGFYRVAQQANVPILLGYLDYEKKVIGIGDVIHPSGDIEADMRKILDFYNTVTPKHKDRYKKI